jgi:CRISPR system Cascade subunit CasA
LTAERSAAGFDLTSEPWILCLLHDGTMTELSLQDVFARADDITEIVGEVPTQSFAILRLLLAVMYRALPHYSSHEQWAQWWHEGLPGDDIAAYLHAHRHRFDLFDPKQPFFQVADLRTAKGEVKGVSQLIFDLPTNAQHFSTRSGSGAESLRFAEAARWLVNLQAFDQSGIKSGAVGDARVKGGKGYPIGVAWCGLLGGIVIEGKTLRETLLLNLVLPTELDATPEDDTPPWERAPQSASPDGPEDGRPPRGPVDLYTWQSRRVRLWREGDLVVGSLVTNGDKLTPQNRFRVEPMTAWRHSPAQQKALKLPSVYMPNEHRPERAFWRGISSLIARRPTPSGSEPPRWRAPELVEWLAALSDLCLPADTRVSLRATGVIYGSNNSVIDEVIDDRMRVAIAVLAESDRPLSAAAQDAVSVAERGVRLLTSLGDNLRFAEGGDSGGDDVRAREQAFHELGRRYLPWLEGLSTHTSVIAAEAEWKAAAREVIAGLGAELVSRAGPTAWSGRDRDGKVMDTPTADIYFRAGLNTVFGPPPSTASEPNQRKEDPNQRDQEET